MTLANQTLASNHAKLAITYDGKFGDLPDPIAYDSSDEDIRHWATEAVRSGGVPGIPAIAHANFEGFVVERYPAGDGRPFATIAVRPKTPFGCNIA